VSKARSGHVLATVLFTDIVDSSRLAHELGDARWRALLTRHHAIIRKAIKRCHGREIDNAGDGFFATFADQVDAIRCACEISDGVREFGIEVRAGCHIGQAEVLGRKLGGITVHAGARVMSEAAPSEVLVSSMIKDLVPSSGFEFADRGIHHLKGIEGEWHLYAVTSVDGKPRALPLDPDEAVHLREEIKPLPIVERRWGRVAIAVFAVVIAAAAVLLVLNRPHPVQIRPNSLLRIDPKTDKVVAAVPATEPSGQIAIVPPNKIWVLSTLNHVISIVDSASEQVMTLGVFGAAASSGSGEGIVYAYGLVWVTGGNDQLEELDPNSHIVEGSLKIPGGPALLASGFGRIWVMVHDSNRAVAIDPKTGQVVITARTGEGGNGIGIGEGAVWLSSYGDGTVSKIDPVTGARTEIDVGETGIAGPATIGIGFGSAWVSDVLNGVVYRIDPATDAVQATIAVGKPSGSYASDIAMADGSMWVTSPESKTIVRIDPATDSVQARIHLPYAPLDLTVGLGSVWVTTSR
jgi:class 3 adenylate cyclase/streptogramin lyase